MSTLRWSGRGAAVAAAALTFAAILLAAVGVPSAAEQGVVVAAVAATVVALLVGRAVRRAGGPPAAPAPTDAIDAVVGRFARPVPLDESLQQVVDALRAAPGHRRVELWLTAGGRLRLACRLPLVDRGPIELDPPAAAVAAGAGVIGDAWLRTWLPPLAATGHGDDLTRAAPLAVRGALLGVVVLRRDPGEPAFGPADDERLTRVARPLSAALEQHRLTEALEASVAELQRRNAELQASRARLVSAADTERRRLERDLHDGAQSRLTALAVRAQVARRLAEQDPARVDELLCGIETELAGLRDELRHLAHGIVPPLLLTGGLGDALRDAASRSPIGVEVEVHRVERLRPEVEAAVYYCCVEALQNVVKHGGDGARARVLVELGDGQLRFSVVDDGVGMAADRAGEGQGLVNMTDRIGALGGHVEIVAGAAGGVEVRGQLPAGPEVSDR